MTSTFRGKWTFFVPGNKHYVGYAGSAPFLSMLPGPPRKEIIIVFVLRSDTQLCFFMQNGKYVEPGPGTLPLTDHPERAGFFEFPGHDYKNLPTSFTAKIHSLVDNSYLYDVETMLYSEKDEHIGRVFTIAQHTPTLEQIQTSAKGDGLDLAGVDLSGGALDNVSLVGADFSYSNLNTVKLTSCTLTKALLNNCTMVKTDFSGSNLSGANLNHLDLTGVVVGAALPHFCTNPDQAPSSADLRTTFFESKLNQSLLGTEWSKLDLTKATVLNIASPLSSQSKPLTAKHSILTSLNNNDLQKLSLPFAVFDNAVLDNVNLNDCDLTNASFKQASMHGTVLSNAILKNANLTGAQLGGLSMLFTLPAGYEAHLNAGPTVDAALRDQFAQHGITLSATATLSTQSVNRVWEVNDLGNNIVYTVRLATKTDSGQELTVYKPGSPASLANAYLPNAILTGANLFGITANNIQFYGSNARVDGSAILENAKLNNSNLSTVNFTQAQLMGANLSDSHLINAKFNKANLSLSAAGTDTDLSNANLQGADFTDAQLYGAKLVNAAVAVKVPTKINPNQGGVYLFSLPYSGDTATLEQYKTELTSEAGSYFSLTPDVAEKVVSTYVLDLNAKNFPDPLKLAFLKHKPLIKWSAVAQVSVIEPDHVWQIVEMDNTLHPQTYIVWTDVNVKGQLELYAGLPMTITQAGFKKCGTTIRWQATVAIDAPNQQWLLDNDSENPLNSSTGYVKFLVKLNGDVLDVYGTALRIVRLGTQQQQEFDTETCRVTLLNQGNMSAETVCPNGATLGVNQSHSGQSWSDLWMRASTPPRPPDCVPTDFVWCDPPKVKL